MLLSYNHMNTQLRVCMELQKLHVQTMCTMLHFLPLNISEELALVASAFANNGIFCCSRFKSVVWEAGAVYKQRNQAQPNLGTAKEEVHLYQCLYGLL